MVSPRVRAIVALVVGIGTIASIIALVGPTRVKDAILAASWPYLLLAAGAYVLFFALRGLRWRTLLSARGHVRFTSTTSATAVGWLANSILPLKGGDVIRAAIITKREGLAAGETAASIALERILDLVGLATIAAAGLLLIPDGATPAWMERAIGIAWVLPIGATLILVGILAAREPALRLAQRACSRLGRFGAVLYKFLVDAVEGAASLGRRPRVLLLLVPQTVAVALAQVLVFTFLAMAFIPMLPFGLAFCGTAIFSLSFIVSVTPGNIGTYEAAFGAVFAALGTPLEVGLPAAILTHLTTTVLVGILGSAGFLTLSLTNTPARPRSSPATTGGGHP